MNEESVVAVYENVEQARIGVHILNRSDVPNDKVSLVTAHLEQRPEVEVRLLQGEDDVRDAFVGAGIGSLVGVLAGASLIAFGGTMTLVAGPLAGLATGAVVGTFLGKMEGWGIHRHRVEHYERLVEAGHPLLVVTGDPLQNAEVYRILKQTGPRELHLYATSDDEASAAPSE
ncbi:MAG: hypothetical protein KDA60_05665 [Planctomycetales bacterium]|nr:hypothetical protein [Planctomycetales bacterium]